MNGVYIYYDSDTNTGAVSKVIGTIWPNVKSPTKVRFNTPYTNGERREKKKRPPHLASEQLE